MVYSITINRMENLPVIKKVKVAQPEIDDDGNPTGKINHDVEIDYESHEWALTGKQEIEIPHSPNSLQVISQIAGLSGFNAKLKCYDSNIRFMVEFKTKEPTEQADSIKEIMFCTVCNRFEFEFTARRSESGSAVAYSCTECGKLLLQKQS